MNWTEFNKEYDKYQLSHISTWYDACIVPGFARLITYIAFSLNLSPNFLTVLSFLFILSGMGLLLLAPFNLMVQILSLGLLQFGYYIDFADGYLARLQNKSSLFGAFLDPFIDRCTNFIVLIIFGYLWFVAHPLCVNANAIILFVISSSLYIIYTIAMLISGYVFVDSRGTMQRFGKSWKEKTLKLPYQLMNLGVHFLVLSLAYIFDVIYYAVLFYGMLSFLIIIGLICYLYVGESKSKGKLQ